MNYPWGKHICQSSWLGSYSYKIWCCHNLRKIPRLLLFLLQIYLWSFCSIASRISFLTIFFFTQFTSVARFDVYNWYRPNTYGFFLFFVCVDVINESSDRTYTLFQHCFVWFAVTCFVTNFIFTPFAIYLLFCWFIIKLCNKYNFFFNLFHVKIIIIEILPYASLYYKKRVVRSTVIPSI